MPRPRSLSPEEVERVSDATRALAAELGSQLAVANALRMPDGKTVSQQTVSNAMRGGAVGVTFARAIAAHLGLTFEELVQGVPQKADGVRRNEELHGWAQAAAEVLADELAPRYAVEAASKAFVAFPVRRVDATLVYDQAMLWLKHAPLNVRKAAEKADIAQQLAREEAEEDRRHGARARSGAQPHDDHTAEVPARRPRARR